jgi:hypothetical protein
VVDRDGCFVWEKSAVQASVMAGTERFWAKDKSSADEFQQRLEDAVDKEIDLPDDIMPDFVSSVIAEKLVSTRPGRKLKKWGPVQPVRQSSRIDRSRNIMEKAEERKKIINLEKPNLAGIMSSYPFHVLPVDELDSMADKFGVSINESVDDSNVLVSVSNSSSSGPSSCNDERQEELADQWIEVVRKSRGKHPGRSVNDMCFLEQQKYFCTW